MNISNNVCNHNLNMSVAVPLVPKLSAKKTVGERGLEQG